MAPRCASLCGSARRRVSRSTYSPMPVVAPNQHAAIPAPPCQKPGRSRYARGAPMRVAGTSSKRTSTLALARMPTADHPVSVTWTPGRRMSTATSTDSSHSSHAVTSACVTDAAPEHHALVPRRMRRCRRQWRACRRRLGGPHCPDRARLRPAHATRVRWRWPSRVRTADRRERHARRAPTRVTRRAKGQSWARSSAEVR